MVLVSGINGGYGSGISGGYGSGISGSGSTQAIVEDECDETDECAEVMTMDEDEGDSITDTIAYTAISCSLLCMNNVTTNPLHQVHYQTSYILL